MKTRPDAKKMTFEGATVEEAIQKALDSTGLTREEIIIKVVSEEKRGLFGMEGAMPAKIVVSPKK